MSLLFETIRIVDGVPLHLGYHAARMNRSREELFGGRKWGGPAGEGKRGSVPPPIDLAAEVVVPPDLPAGIHRCRVLYGETIEEISFAPYVARTVDTLSIVQADGLSYAHKYTDRSAIEKLREGSVGDDILMVRGGFVTDTSYANIAFFDGAHWVTPASPLLPGTARARLLDEGRITAGDIGAGDLSGYKKAVLFNAMLDFREDPYIDINNIR